MLLFAQDSESQNCPAQRPQAWEEPATRLSVMVKYILLKIFWERAEHISTHTLVFVKVHRDQAE